MLAVEVVAQGKGLLRGEVKVEAGREARDGVQVIGRVRLVSAAFVKWRVSDVHVALIVHCSVAEVVSRSLRTDTDIVSYFFDVAAELVSVASHESAIGVLGHSEGLALLQLLAEVVVLSLGDQLTVVSALLALGRVGLVELVDDNVTADAGVALTQLP